MYRDFFNVSIVYSSKYFPLILRDWPLIGMIAIVFNLVRSFNGLVLVDELENHFKIKFSLSEITDVKNVADIKRHLKNHNVS